MVYLYLAIAIISEVVATSAIKSTVEFTRLGPSLLVIFGYIISFYCLSLVLKELPVGITYAIWSGLGIVLVTLVAFFVYQQKPDLAAILGMALIIAGIVIMQLFSNTLH